MQICTRCQRRLLSLGGTKVIEIQIHIQILACVLMHFKSRHKYLSLGEIQAIMRVLEFPPRLSCSSRVSLLSLNIRQIL